MESPHSDFPLAGIRFTNGWALGKVACLPGWRMIRYPPFPDHTIWYIVSGQGEVRVAGQTFVVRKGSCIVFRPGDRPDAFQDENDRLTAIYVHFGMGDERRHSMLVPRFTSFEDVYDMEAILNRLLIVGTFEMMWRDEEFDCLIRQFMLHLLRVHRESGRGGNLSAAQVASVRRAIRYIGECDGIVTSSGLAAHTGLSAKYVSRLFKRYTGQSVREYATRVKLGRAKQLLMQSPMTVTQVAESLGYRTFTRSATCSNGITACRLRIAGASRSPS